MSRIAGRIAGQLFCFSFFQYVVESSSLTRKEPRRKEYELMFFTIYSLYIHFGGEPGKNQQYSFWRNAPLRDAPAIANAVGSSWTTKHCFAARTKQERAIITFCHRAESSGANVFFAAQEENETIGRLEKKRMSAPAATNRTLKLAKLCLTHGGVAGFYVEEVLSLALSSLAVLGQGIGGFSDSSSTTRPPLHARDCKPIQLLEHASLRD